MIAPILLFFSRYTRIRTVSIYALTTPLPPMTTGILALIYVKHFPMQAYGLYGVLTAIVTLLALFADLGFSQAILRNYYDRHRETQVAHTYLGAMIFGSRVLSLVLLTAACGLLFTVRDIFGLGETRRALILTAGCIAFFDRTSELLGAVCQALEKPGYFAAGRVVQSVLSLFLGVVFVIVFHYGILGAFGALAIAKCASGLIYQYIVRYRLEIRLGKAELKMLASSLSFGFPIFVNSYAAWLRGSAIRPTLTHLVSWPALGAFSFASTLAEMPSLISSAVDVALAPIYYKGRVDNRQGYRKKNRIFSIAFATVLFAIWAVMILFLPDAIRFWAGVRYAQAAPVCALLLCATYVRVHHTFLMKQINFLRRTWFLPMLAIPIGLLTILFTIITCRSFGIIAAGVMILLAEILLHLGMAASILRYEQLDYSPKTVMVYAAALLLIAVWCAMGNPMPLHLPSLATKLVLLLTVLAYSGWVLHRNRTLILNLVRH